MRQGCGESRTLNFKFCMIKEVNVGWPWLLYFGTHNDSVVNTGGTLRTSMYSASTLFRIATERKDVGFRISLSIRKKQNLTFKIKLLFHPVTFQMMSSFNLRHSYPSWLVGLWNVFLFVCFSLFWFFFFMGSQDIRPQSLIVDDVYKFRFCFRSVCSSI